MGKSTGARDRARGKQVARKTKKRAEKKSKKDSTTKRGLKFELRAKRAIAQIKPELDVGHNVRLMTEPGARRQFDVIGRVDGLLSHTYEARDHGRKVGTAQVEGFETKNATLKDKPHVAGIVSAQGFWERTVDWVRFYRDPQNERKYVQELYHLRPSVPDDWNGDIRQIQISSTGLSLRTLPIRIVYGDTLAEGSTREVTLTSGRQDSFVHDADGRIVANLIDLLNREMRTAQKSGNIARRIVALPSGSFLTVQGCTRSVVGMEVGFEEIAIPATALIDHSGRYPDTLIDALTEKKWLIEDRESALKASRTGFNLTLAFTEPEDHELFEIEELPPPPRIEGVGVPAGLGERVAALSLHRAIAMLRAGSRPEAIPEELLELVAEARRAMEAGDDSEAERLYQESLRLGTALEALAALGYLASKRGNHERAAFHSLTAARMFPFEPQGFANLAACLIAQRDLKRARSVVDRVRTLHGITYQMRRQEADLLYYEDRFSEAAEVFFELSLDDEEDAALVANLARCEHAMGNHAAAAWDAERAAKKAPDNVAIAILAAGYAELVEDPDLVLRVVERFAERRTALPLGLARYAVNAALVRRNLRGAASWLERVPRSEWKAGDFAVYAQVRNIADGGLAGIAEMRLALVAPDLTDDIRVALAELSVRAALPAEVLVAVEQCADPRATRLRALAHAMLGDGDAILRCVASLPVEEANRIVAECFAHCPSKIGGDLAALTLLGDWLVEQESDDADVLKRQAWLVAAKACGGKDATTGHRALRLIDRLRAASADANETILSEALALIACGRLAEARTLIDSLNPRDHHVDRLAACAYSAMNAGAMTIAFGFADAAARSGRELLNFPREQLHTIHVLSALACGKDQDDVRRIAANKILGTDRGGRLAGALLHYVERRLAACINELRPLLGPTGRMLEAFRLNAQCLAEQGAFSDLLPLARRSMPSIEKLVAWASERSSGPFDVSLLPAVAATFALRGIPEYAVVAATGYLSQTYPAADWVGALQIAFSQAPNCQRVWIARLGYPARYIQSLFTLPPRVPDA